jgi:hypothetical protein
VKTLILGLVLFAMLAASVVGLVLGWTHGKLPEISVHGWIALTIGTVLSLALGGGLMALSFHSSRAGFDDRADQAGRPPKERQGPEA